MVWVPVALFSYREANLLSHLMLDVCESLSFKCWIPAHHQQCDGIIERLNRTFKSMIRRHVAKFSSNWDNYMPGDYRNTPHKAIWEKPSSSSLVWIFGCPQKWHYYRLSPWNLLMCQTIVNIWYCHYPQPVHLLQATLRLLNNATRNSMTRRHIRSLTNLETGCWCSSFKKRCTTKDKVPQHHGNIHTLMGSNTQLVIHKHTAIMIFTHRGNGSPNQQCVYS